MTEFNSTKDSEREYEEAMRSTPPPEQGEPITRDRHNIELFNRTEGRFYGTVILKDWIRLGKVSGHAITGFISHHMKEEVNPAIGDRDSNWFFKIASFDTKRNFIIFGCQVKGVYQHSIGEELAIRESDFRVDLES